MTKNVVRVATTGLLALAAALAFALTGSLAQAAASDEPSNTGIIAGDELCC
ncbi:hypothetical protein [Glycomyces harbinensis]|uniref:Uncharacterized protein n=1 Tax=Glycomyces harbinensis TaxID=58114 RepID=A0A1G7DQQ5_9ACTN|nr:hypothetical protein [Glycomyces harbinensis]SDE53799.1 hypothetical protein SAMN05216270_12736 [Glycomyces harbinensis]